MQQHEIINGKMISRFGGILVLSMSREHILHWNKKCVHVTFKQTVPWNVFHKFVFLSSFS